MFEPCPECEGIGGVHNIDGVFTECSTCEGRGRVVSESVIEEIARALYAADDGWAELWDNVGDELRQTYREDARAASRVVLEHMEDNK